MTINYTTAGQVRDRITAGDSSDAVVVLQSFMNELVSSGKVDGDSISRVAKSSIGVVVRAGTSKPDISTAETLKSTLLSVKSVTFTDPKSGGASGIFVASVIEKLGLSKEVMAKAKLVVGGGPSAELVAKGEAELGISQVSELLPVPGIEFVQPIAKELQFESVLLAGVTAGARESAAAKEFVGFLTSPAAMAVIKAKGMDPG